MILLQALEPISFPKGEQSIRIEAANVASQHSRVRCGFTLLMFILLRSWFSNSC